MIQMIYASAATVEFSDEDLKALLLTARERNQELEISGMLVYHEGSFLQILEGHEDAVLALYAKIERDDRHDNVKMLLRSEIDERSFGEWKMGFYDANRGAGIADAGFVDFFRGGLLFDVSKGDRARSVLLQFREGAWRQHVDT